MLQDSGNAESVDWKKVHSAVRWDSPEAAELLTEPLAINCVDPVTGNQPIHIATQNGHLNLVRLLLERRADPNAKNGKDNTPLHMAIGYDYYECGQILLQHGADMTICNLADVPSSRGLDGDKCFGMAAFISATKSKSAEEMLAALKVCLGDIEFLDKASFAQSGMKAKKTLGESWTPEMQEQFKHIMMQL
jgi:ankyrin repeat protein